MADPRSSAGSCDQPAVPARLKSPRSKLPYVTLAVAGGARVAEIRSALGMSSPSRYPVVRDLREAGLVERGDDGAYRLEDVEATAIEAR